VEIRYLWRLIAAHVRFITTASLVAALVGLSVTYLLPEKYRASTTILIRPQRRVEFTPAQQSMLDFPPSISQPPQTISQTYAGMMTSTAVATRVVRVLGLDTPAPEPSRPWFSRGYRWARNTVRHAINSTWDFVRFGRVETQDAYWAAVERVMQGLDAAPVQDTYLFSLTATWDDPQVAARIANTAAEAFTQYAEEARRAEANTSVPFFGTQLETLRSELRAARDRLAAYRAENNLSSIDEQINLSLKTLAELEASHEEAVNQSAEAQAALVEIDQLLARETKELHTIGTVASNPVVQSLKEQLARDQVRLAALHETLTPTHPEVRALSASIEEARRRIGNESAQINASDTSELNPFYRALTQQRLDRSVAARSLAARASALEASVARYRAQVAAQSSHRGELSRLELETEVLENEYRLLTNKSEEARLAGAQEITDIRALAAAVPPLYPTSPIKLFYTVGAFVLGLIGSLFVLLVSDYTKPRIRTVEDVARVIGVPTLAHIPGMSSSRSVTDLLGDSAAYEGMIARIAARNPRRRAAS
jgi:succinoglycan biosynthesis transport protein ExoP